MQLTEVLNELLAGHTDSGIDDVEGVVLLVGLDHDLQVRRSLKDTRVGQGHESDLVKSIRCVGDQLPKEDLKWLV